VRGLLSPSSFAKASAFANATAGRVGGLVCMGSFPLTFDPLPGGEERRCEAQGTFFGDGSKRRGASFLRCSRLYGLVVGVWVTELFQSSIGVCGKAQSLLVKARVALEWGTLVGIILQSWRLGGFALMGGRRIACAR